jgi:hypothetical protein
VVVIKGVQLKDDLFHDSTIDFPQFDNYVILERDKIWAIIYTGALVTY